MILNRKLNPYSSSIVGYWPLKSDLNSRTSGVAAGTIARAGTGHFLTGNGILSSKGSNVGRFETRGLLLEPASTNALIHSDDLEDAAWSLLAGAPLTFESGHTDPKGGTTAFKCTASAASIYSQSTAALSTNCVSVWFKCATPGGSCSISFGTSVGSVTQITTNDTWTKYTHVNAEDGFVFGSLGFQAGDSFYMWNPQAEINTYSTTDIITAGSTGTRAGDVVSLPSGVVPNINTSFAIAADVLFRNAPVSSFSLFNFAGETTGRIVTIDSSLNIEGSYGGSASATVTPMFTVGRRHRVLFTGNNSVWRIYVDGVLATNGSVGGSGNHTSITINAAAGGCANVREVLGYNRYFATAAEALNELKFH